MNLLLVCLYFYGSVWIRRGLFMDSYRFVWIRCGLSVGLHGVVCVCVDLPWSCIAFHGLFVDLHELAWICMDSLWNACECAWTR